MTNKKFTYSFDVQNVETGIDAISVAHNGNSTLCDISTVVELKDQSGDFEVYFTDGKFHTSVGRRIIVTTDTAAKADIIARLGNLEIEFAQQRLLDAA